MIVLQVIGGHLFFNYKYIFYDFGSIAEATEDSSELIRSVQCL